MGLLSFLNKKHEFTENVCVNEEAKRKNMMTALRKSLSGGCITIVTYHFRNNHDTFIEWLEREKIPYQEESNAYWLDGLTTASNKVHLILAKDLIGRVRQAVPETPIEIEVHLIEHYPLPAKDKVVLSLAETISARIRFIAWSSLDEPLMRFFGGERITGMMKQLGMKDNAIITHPFVAKAIRNAQEKIARKTVSESEYRSSDEWFTRHFSEKYT